MKPWRQNAKDAASFPSGVQYDVLPAAYSEGSALARLETTIGLVDHEDAAFAAHHAIVAVTTAGVCGPRHQWPTICARARAQGQHDVNSEE
jgi:hypothetical protein